MSIGEFQELMKTLYGDRDVDRGVQGTMLWLVSEVGEFIDAVIKHRSLESMKDEAADVLAWLCSACDVLGIDLEAAATSKYNGKCPRCDSNPCQCSKK